MAAPAGGPSPLHSPFCLKGVFSVCELLLLEDEPTRSFSACLHLFLCCLQSLQRLSASVFIVLRLQAAAGRLSGGWVGA